MKKAIIPTLLILLPISPNIDAKENKTKGLCTLSFRSDKWSDVTAVNMRDALKGYRINLSQKNNFKSVQAQPDGSEIQHQGEAPKELQPYDVELNLVREKNSGWDNHEKISISLNILEREGDRLFAGPFKASVMRKIAKKDDLDSEGYPQLLTQIKINSYSVELKVSCGGPL